MNTYFNMIKNIVLYTVDFNGIVLYIDIDLFVNLIF